jgi:hypothetical protein
MGGAVSLPRFETDAKARVFHCVKRSKLPGGHGYAETREVAMAAFAKSWRREKLAPPGSRATPPARQAETGKFPRNLLITGAVVEPLDHVA